MGVWQRLRGLFGEETKALPTKPEEVAPEEQKVEELRPPSAPELIGAALIARDFAAASKVLGGARETEGEAAVLEATFAVLGPKASDAEAAPVAAPDDARERFLVTLAEVLVARGERPRAADVLSRATSPAALVLRADLLVEGIAGSPSRDDLDRALAVLSRALVLDIDAPGARERWERLRVRLGHGVVSSGPSVGATLVAAAPSLPYVLLREVARGGAGVVYQAHEEIIPGRPRLLALKLLHDDQPRMRAQLGHEARVAATLRGTGVVRIVDLDAEAGWLAMGWAEGGSLRARLREGRPGDLLLEAPMTWLHAFVATLADVHAAGWVHGDVKPANLLFDADDAPLVSDFGLARRFGEPMTSGSPGYISPERAAGAPCDPRDDVFGLGRALEDLLAKNEGLVGADEVRRLARLCVAPAPVRPADARKVLEQLE